MLRKCGIRVATATGVGTSASAPKGTSWESRVASFIAEKSASRSHAVEAKLERVGKGDYTPVHVAFPGLADREAPSSADATRADPQTAVVSQPPDAHVVSAAVVGPPSAGKSSLVNSLATSHLMATAARAGTTDRTTKAVATVGNTQISMLDTPGLFQLRHSAKGRNAKQHAQLSERAYQGFDSLMAADVALFVFNGERHRIDPAEVGVLRKVYSCCVRREVPLLLVLSKMDLVAARKGSASGPRAYGYLRRSIDEAGVEFAATFETSAKTFHGIIELKDFVARYGRPGNWTHYRQESTDMLPPERAWMVVKEVFARHIERDPSAVRHRVVGWTKRSNGETEVYVEVFAESFGSMTAFWSALPAIGPMACESLSAALNTKCYVLFKPFLARGGLGPV